MWMFVIMVLVLINLVLSVVGVVDATEYRRPAWDAIRHDRAVIIGLLALSAVLWVLFLMPLWYWVFLRPGLQRASVGSRAA